MKAQIEGAPVEQRATPDDYRVVFESPVGALVLDDPCGASPEPCSFPAARTASARPHSASAAARPSSTFCE
ncbi:hypothetical protein [Burkholderia contaminans]|uniref:hypothetical protein n=1 Tax=Burkholderia contaminans TaxID=488447 RepID=UPI0011B1CA13|nr:hypothetical protein [Burkholderia contaminans]